MESTTEKVRKKPGPLPGAEMVRSNILIEPDLLEWAKRQPGGLSGMVRRLVREARDGGQREPGTRN